MDAELGRCSNRDKPWPLPPSLTIAAARTHPRYRHHLEPGARCELDDGHDGPHRAGCLLWNDPPVIYVGGELRSPPTGPWQLLGETVT